MQIADALDEIRTRNARNERFDSADVLDTLLEVTNPAELELMRQEEEDAELARKAFRTEEDKFVRRVVDDGADEADLSKEEAKADILSFKKTVKRRRDMGAVLGIKKKLKPLV